MRRPALLDLAQLAACVITLFAVVSCGEETPTQPSSPANLSPATASLAATSNSWSPIAAMPCCDGSGVSVGVVPATTGPSVLYVFGGTDANGHTGARVRAYVVATNSWSVKSPVVPSFELNGVGNIGGKLYFTGGFDEHESTFRDPRTWAYDPATDVMTQKADMPFRTAEGVTGVIGDKLYVLPGSCDANVVNATIRLPTSG